VDRLYQSRWVVSVLAVTVLGKILADIFSLAGKMCDFY